MKNNEEILEMNEIKTMLAGYCFTKEAKEKALLLTPYMKELELRAALRETTEAKTMLEKCGNPPLTAIEDLEEMLTIADKGGCLTAEQLEKIAFTLTAVRRLKDYLNRCKAYELSLAYYEENLDSMDDVLEELNQKIRYGKVDDYASKLLRDLRSDIDKKQTKMREKADFVIRNFKDCMSDSFSTIKNGHICIPVKKDCKLKIRGTVIDKSATGNTLFIEPVQVSELYEELNELMIEEENEVIRILYTLTAMLADSMEPMQQNKRTIEKLDFAFAKAQMSLQYDGTEPQITLDRYIKIEDGRHPLMKKEINVPLQFEIGNGINGIIITGPNTGGKTVAIKTVALNAMLAQSGMHVACKKGVFCMNDAYLCDIGDGQNIAENLSTFSAHIVNVLDILKNAGKDSLVIMDELGSGTDPTEGMGIAIAILEELKKSGALYLVTTHYPEVKNYASKTEGVVNARMTFDKESLRPLYQLVIGEAGESCAFYIARRLGMPVDMLERASRAAYGESLSEEFAVNEDENSIKELRSGKGKIVRHKHKTNNNDALKYKLGDSVMVYPDKKVAIVCKTADDKGVLMVQMQKKKIHISHKRVKLLVAATKLYPEDYDFSIIFDSVAKRKAQHDMKRKYVEEAFVMDEEDSTLSR